MSKFIGIIVGGIEIIAGIAVTIISGGALAPIGGLLISAGVGTLIGGAGSLISDAISGSGSSPNGGYTTTVRNPIQPWNIIYGQAVVGGVYVFFNEWGQNDKYWDMVIVVASHPCFRVDALLLNKQMIQFNSGGGAWDGVSGDSFSPLEQVANIVHISRANGVVTVHIDANIPYAEPGVDLQIRNITGDRTLNGKYTIAQIVSRTTSGAGTLVFTYICGGLNSIVDLEGQVKTLWPNYGRKIHMEVCDGTHTTTFPGMLTGTPNDGDTSDLINNPDNPWNATCLNLGRTSIFLRLHYDQTVWANGFPTPSFLIRGKYDIYDPRLGAYGAPGTTAYTTNAALCTADYLSNNTWGFKADYVSEIPSAPLISAANACDEAVTLAAGGTEPRYTCNGNFQLVKNRGELLQNLLTACAGRLTYNGGQFVIWPGVWYGATPVTPPGIGQMSGPFQWKPTTSIRDRFNGVKGPYISPANNWQPSDVPPYAQDSLHGYTSSGAAAWSSATTYSPGDETTFTSVGYVALIASINKQPDTHPSYWSRYYTDQNVIADGGDRRWLEWQLPFTISSSMAQRIFKIELLRRRMGGAGTFRYNMWGYAMTVLDVIPMTLAYFGWTNKLLEVTAHRFLVTDQEQGGGNSVAVLGTEIDVQETDSSIYDWSPTEELAPQGYQQATNPTAYTPAAPTNLVLQSDSFTAVVVQGAIQDVILVSWTPPADGYVTNGGHIELQYQNYIAPVTSGTVAIDTAGNVTFSNPLLLPGYLEAVLIIGGTTVYTIASITSTTTGTVTPHPGTAVSATSAFVLHAQNAIWTGLPSVQPTVTQVPITGVIDGQVYTVEIRSVNAAGIPSAWVSGNVTAAGQRAPFPWQPNGEFPVVSDVMTQDSSFVITLDFFTDAGGNPIPQVEFGGYPPVNTPGLAPVPDFSSVTAVVATTGGNLPPGIYTFVMEAYDTTSTTNPGVSDPSEPFTVTVPAGTNTNKITLSGYTFGAGTQGFALFMAEGRDISTLALAKFLLTSLPTSVAVTAIPPRTFGPRDDDADHFHVQGFDLSDGGVWNLQTDGPVVSSVLRLPGAAGVGFTVDQFADYIVEWLPGGIAGVGSATPIARARILTHDTDGNFTLQDSTGWATNPGDLIRCAFKLATATANSFSDPNVDNVLVPGGNTSDDAGREVWVLKGGSVEQIQTVKSNTTTGWTINDTFDPPITTDSHIVIVWPTAVYDFVGGSFTTTSDQPTTTIPTIAKIQTANYIGGVVLFRVFTESVNLAVNNSNYPVRLLYIAGRAGASTGGGFFAV